MITIFNRAELTLTYSVEQQAKLREALAAAGIDYRLRVHTDSRGVGRMGRMTSAGTEYIFYVHRDDLDAARAAIIR